MAVGQYQRNDQRTEFLVNVKGDGDQDPTQVTKICEQFNNVTL